MVFVGAGRHPDLQHLCVKKFKRAKGLMSRFLPILLNSSNLTISQLDTEAYVRQ